MKVVYYKREQTFSAVLICVKALKGKHTSMDTDKTFQSKDILF